MNVRTARKVLSAHKGMSKRMTRRLHQLHPPYYDAEGHYCSPSWHMYHRIARAWIIVKRKQRMYQDRFRLL